MKKLLSAAVLALAMAGGTLGLTAMRTGDPSGLHQPVVDQDDVLGVQAPTVTYTTGSHTITAAFNAQTIVVTGASTIAYDTAANLGAGFYSVVDADGATATVTAGGQTWTVTTGKILVLRVANGKHNILVSTLTAHD